jgi:hypothetical protein
VTDQTGSQTQPTSAGPVRNPTGVVEFQIRGSAFGPDGFRVPARFKTQPTYLHPGGIPNWAGQFRSGPLSNPVRFQSPHGPLSNCAVQFQIHGPVGFAIPLGFWAGSLSIRAVPSSQVRNQTDRRGCHGPVSNLRVRFQSGFQTGPAWSSYPDRADHFKPNRHGQVVKSTCNPRCGPVPKPTCPSPAAVFQVQLPAQFRTAPGRKTSASKRTVGRQNHSTQDSHVVPHHGTN